MLRALCALTLCSALVACTPEGDVAQPETDTTGETTNNLDDATGNYQVSLRYRDFANGTTLVDQTVTGNLFVSFDGAPLPVAGSKYPLQTADLVLDIPSFEDPNQQVKRHFKARFEVSNLSDGSAHYLANIGNASLVDFSIPDAQNVFDSSYDPLTQRAQRTIALDPKTQYLTVNLIHFPTGHKATVVVMSQPLTGPDRLEHQYWLTPRSN